MKHEEATLRTKEMLAASLKKKMCRKPLSKITVSELIADCNLNRRTFYYHFEDIYALAAWMFDQEAVELLKKSDSCLTWDEGVLLLLKYVQQNEPLCKCALDGLGRDYLRKFFKDEVLGIIGHIIRELADGLNVQPQIIDFLANFYTGALAETVIRWLSGGMKESPEALIHLLEITLHGNLRTALERAAQEGKSVNTTACRPS